MTLNKACHVQVKISDHTCLLHSNQSYKSPYLLLSAKNLLFLIYVSKTEVGFVSLAK